jgi:hypothetical protein
MAITEFVPPEGQKVAHNIPPYHWFDGASNVGLLAVIPAVKILLWMDQKLDRCKGKDGWACSAKYYLYMVIALII